MEESNHEMVNMVTQQIGTVINPLIRDTITSYEELSAQMERVANDFGTPPARNVSRPQETDPSIEVPTKRNTNQIIENRVLRQAPLPNIEEPEKVPLLVNRCQDADQVVMQARQDNYEGHNNIANLVENLLAQNGFNMGFRRPNFTSASPEYVLMTELLRNWKVPKFTKFAGETNESTVEHIVRYLIEAGDIANNENLKMKYSEFFDEKCFYLVYYTASEFDPLLDSVRKGFSWSILYGSVQDKPERTSQ